jgi:hypothetical protein
LHVAAVKLDWQAGGNASKKLDAAAENKMYSGGGGAAAK